MLAASDRIPDEAQRVGDGGLVAGVQVLLVLVLEVAVLAGES